MLEFYFHWLRMKWLDFILHLYTVTDFCNLYSKILFIAKDYGKICVLR